LGKYVEPALSGLCERKPRRHVWLDAFDIPSIARHHALADALATAQRLLVLERKAAEQGIRTVSALRKAAAGERWLSRGSR
jgi:hypothetical protein